jgi:putative transcriptional regulator
MSFVWLKPALLSLAMLFSPATLSAVAPSLGPPSPGPGPHGSSLTGQLLIATPEMEDPRFRAAVILVVRHDEGGAIGIIINRPIAVRPVAELLEATGQDGTGVSGNVRVFSGGPVRPQTGFILHSADYRRAATLDIDGRVAMTNSAEILRDIGQAGGPAKSLIAFGYAGWGPGQLDGELSHGVWFTAPEDPALVFDEERDRVWDRAVARRTVPL